MAKIKNVLTPISSFKIADIHEIWVAPKIQGSLAKPPDFVGVQNWIVVQGPNFEFRPNKLVTDLIVVVDNQGNKLGYLNKLFNFTYVSNLKFELTETIDIAEKEVAFNLWLVYQAHTILDTKEHPEFNAEIAIVSRLNVIKTEYENYEKNYANNPLIKDNEIDPGQYLFKEFERIGEEKAYKIVSFPNLSNLSNSLGISFKNMRIGFNFLEGYFLFKVTGNKIIILTPRSRQKNHCLCYVLKADRKLNPAARVFSFAGNFYTVSDDALLVLTHEDSLGREEHDYLIFDGAVDTKELLDEAVAFEFSFLGDLVINKKTKSLYSVLYEGDVDFGGIWYNPYYTDYLKDLNRVQGIYQCAWDNWLANHELAQTALLGSRWCLFRHKITDKILAVSNYPCRVNRRVLDNVALFMDNDYLLMGNKMLNLEENRVDKFPEQDMYLGARLINVGGELVIC